MSKPWGLYSVAIAILVIAFGYVAINEPKQIGAATPGFLTAGLMVVLFAVIVPPAQLAFARKNVPFDSEIPFSRSLAERIVALLRSVETMMAWLAIFLAGAISFSTLASVLPGWHRYEAAATAIGSIGTIAIALGLITKLVTDHNRLQKAILADPDEMKRNEELRHHSGLGLLKNEADPMILMTVPANPTNITVNVAHPEGRRVLWRWLGAFVIFLVAMIALSTLES